MSFVFLTGLNGWAFVYEISGCGIDSCCSYLNFRYRACFEQGAPWYSDNYRVYIHSKTWMWHDKKNTQSKNFLPLYTVLLIYSKVKASQILHGETTPFAPSKNWIKAISIHQIRKTFPVFHIYLVVKKSQEKPCLPDWFPINIPLVTEEILSPTTFVTEWTSIGYCKTSDFFWLIFPIRSSPSLATMRFPHSSLMNKSVGESSKFPMSSLSMQSSSFSNITFFLKSGFF